MGRSSKAMPRFLWGTPTAAKKIPLRESMCFDLKGAPEVKER